MKELFSLLNFDPKTQDGITNITVWLAILVYFLFINFFIIPINVPNEPANYSLYLFVLFVPAATKLIFFSGDPISHKQNNEATFFQGQFPDRYVAAKFKIDKPLAQHLWFKALDKRANEGEIKRTFQYGYTCRLVYYIRRLMFAFALLALLFLVFNTAYIYWRSYHRWVGLGALLTNASQIYNLKGKLFYLAHVAGIPLYLYVANKPNDQKPTGVWARWKHINDRNKAWIDGFTSFDEFKAFVNTEPAAGPKT